jgi:hypothetical protein
MSKSKSKLGQNPLVPRGVGAFFSEDAQGSTAVATPSRPAPASKAADPKPAPKRSSPKSVSQLVNKVTNSGEMDEPLERHTFYLTDTQAQKVKLYALLHRKQISEVMRMLIDNHLKIQP